MGQLTTNPLTDQQLGQLLQVPGCADAVLRRALNDQNGINNQTQPMAASTAKDPTSNIVYWAGNRTYAPITQTQGDDVINEQANPRPLIQMDLTTDMDGYDPGVSVATASASLTDYFGPSGTDLDVVDDYNLFPFALSGDSGLFQLNQGNAVLVPVLMNARAWFSGVTQADWDGTSTVQVQTGRPYSGAANVDGYFAPTAMGYASDPFPNSKKLASGSTVVIVWDFWGPVAGSPAPGWYVWGAFACPS